MTGRRGEFHAGPQPYKQTPIFDEKTMPPGLRNQHRTKDGVWGLIQVIAGRLRYRIVVPPAESILDADNPGVVRPAQLHEVEPLGAVLFFIAFYDKMPAEAGGIDADGEERHG
jgi:tellurite resistance-related uncharacterized protein